MTPERYRRLLFAIVIFAAVWRVILAALMPCISRDGSKFCWYARDLGRVGIDVLRQPGAEQHPLFPALILATQRAGSLFGAADHPLIWQQCGQFVALLAGLSVVLLCAAVSNRLVDLLVLPLDRRRVSLFAATLAAILPLNCWLSSDAMSDEVHLAFYLAGVYCLLRLDSARAGFSAGLFSGLAFLTRPEGAMVVVAGLVTAFAQFVQTKKPAAIVRAAALAVGFIALAAPLWLITGRLTPKKNLFDAPPEFTSASLNANSSQAHPASDPASPRHPSGSAPETAALIRPLLGVLITEHVPWYMLAPRAVWEMLRGGRFIVPLLAFPPLLNLRRRLTTAPMLPIAVCAVGHFGLTVLLLSKWGYLDPRHTLVIIALMIPFAAMLLARMTNIAASHPDPNFRRTLNATIVLLFVPLAVYAVRIPNGQDGYLRVAADWLRANDTAVQSRLLLSGSSPRRIAFYADMRLQQWPENEPTYDKLADHILHFHPDYFAIETGPGRERAGNDELIARLKSDARITHFLTMIHDQISPRGDAVKLFGFAWSKE